MIVVVSSIRFYSIVDMQLIVLVPTPKSYPNCFTPLNKNCTYRLVFHGTIKKITCGKGAHSVLLSC